MAFGMNGLGKRPVSSYIKEDLWCARGSERIHSVLFAPRAMNGYAPVVVCAHAFGGSYRDTVDYAESMARNGYVAVSIDLRGGSSHSTSDGDVMNASVATMAQDIESVVRALVMRSDVDVDNIYLMGQGEGAVAATRVATSGAADIRGMVLCYPTFNLQDLMVKAFGTASKIPESFDLWQVAGRAFGLDAISNDPYAGMESYEGRTIIFHGDRDKIAPFAYSHKAARLLPNARIEVLSKVAHGFFGIAARTVVEESLNMIEATRVRKASAAA
ncbi:MULTISPECIES: alpha/beta hydrolase family protein [Atopobiaceae]|uniref:Serine aminopeptidase S33 domain-containing protein n=1 Tax=Parafannyhessea umbonata TaxID=604330 RepID=A0A1H6HPX5_9ACTN|nr:MULTISPECIES: alpha/beta hydrolase [Atopobiaceae]SEH36234.1 hypothetical protein SAMN05216447_10122 [Parafannyhessea umbonata]SJZ37387.1 hypothetical protein SAMN06298223_0035 [Olsenella sp. KH1P3]